jgi:hypothetical protein
MQESVLEVKEWNWVCSPFCRDKEAKRLWAEKKAIAFNDLQIIRVVMPDDQSDDAKDAMEEEIKHNIHAAKMVKEAIISSRDCVPVTRASKKMRFQSAKEPTFYLNDDDGVVDGPVKKEAEVEVPCPPAVSTKSVPTETTDQ